MKWQIKKARKENITGRGTVLIVDLKENEITEDDWIEQMPITKGDIVEFQSETFRVSAIECSRNLLSGKRGAYVSSKVILVVNSNL